MINLDETALICDLAETYHILDYRSHPVTLVAALSAGLRGNSRIKMLLADLSVEPELLLLATIADRIEMFRFGFTDGKSENQPVSIVEKLCGRSKKSGFSGFDTPQEFEAALARIRGE